MSKYKIEDGAIVDTDKAQNSWAEASDWNGKNHISRAWLSRENAARWLIHNDHKLPDDLADLEQEVVE